MRSADAKSDRVRAQVRRLIRFMSTLGALRREGRPRARPIIVGEVMSEACVVARHHTRNHPQCLLWVKSDGLSRGRLSADVRCTSTDLLRCRDLGCHFTSRQRPLSPSASTDAPVARSIVIFQGLGPFVMVTAIFEPSICAIPWEVCPRLVCLTTRVRVSMRSTMGWPYAPGVTYSLFSDWSASMQL